MRNENNEESELVPPRYTKTKHVAYSYRSRLFSFGTMTKEHKRRRLNVSRFLIVGRSISKNIFVQSSNEDLWTRRSRTFLFLLKSVRQDDGQRRGTRTRPVSENYVVHCTRELQIRRRRRRGGNRSGDFQFGFDWTDVIRNIIFSEESLQIVS